MSGNNGDNGWIHARGLLGGYSSMVGECRGEDGEEDEMDVRTRIGKTPRPVDVSKVPHAAEPNRPEARVS